MLIHMSRRRSFPLFNDHLRSLSPLFRGWKKSGVGKVLLLSLILAAMLSAQ
jgi:hypothetical protein